MSPPPFSLLNEKHHMRSNDVIDHQAGGAMDITSHSARQVSLRLNTRALLTVMAADNVQRAVTWREDHQAGRGKEKKNEKGKEKEGEENTWERIINLTV